MNNILEGIQITNDMEVSAAIGLFINKDIADAKFGDEIITFRKIKTRDCISIVRHNLKGDIIEGCIIPEKDAEVVVESVKTKIKEASDKYGCKQSTKPYVNLQGRWELADGGIPTDTPPVVIIG